MKKLIITSTLLLFTTVSFAQGTLKINVENLKNNDGQLIVMLFKKGSDFGLDEKPFRKIKYTKLSNNKASISIKNVKKGGYAFLIYHDEDKNGECKTNWIGMPKEGVGKSGSLGSRPTDKNSSFDFNGKLKTFNIKLKYL